MDYSPSSIYQEILIRDKIRKFGKRNGLEKALREIKSIGKGWDNATWAAIKAYKPSGGRKVRPMR